MSFFNFTKLDAMENDLDITYKKQSKHLEMVKSYNCICTDKKIKPPKAPVFTSQLYLTVSKSRHTSRRTFCPTSGQ